MSSNCCSRQGRHSGVLETCSFILALSYTDKLLWSILGTFRKDWAIFTSNIWSHWQGRFRYQKKLFPISSIHGNLDFLPKSFKPSTTCWSHFPCGSMACKNTNFDKKNYDFFKVIASFVIHGSTGLTLSVKIV